MSSRGSGSTRCATWFIGMCEPYLDPHGVEHRGDSPCRERIAGELVLRVVERLVHVAPGVLENVLNRSSSYHGPDTFAAYRARDGAGLVNVQDDQRQLVLLAERDAVWSMTRNSSSITSR
jgi:hypothetical protein